MQESAQAAFSYARSKAFSWRIKEKFWESEDVHIHVPAGAIPKDGPSAGVAMATVLVSLLTGKKVRRTLGMTGEVTLRGRVLEVGGVKEKVLAAHRAGLKTIILPKDNEKDLEEVPKEVREAMEFKLVSEMEEVLKLALV
jgi:ATP-dependent Lon protease